MNATLPHNKLRVHYRVLQQGETATVWVAGTTAGDTVTERWPAWLSMSRTQWVPAWLEGEHLESVLVQELRRSHPTAEDVAVDRVTVLRSGVVLQER
jgi:hypothetical protein